MSSTIPPLADRLKKIKASPTLVVSAKAAELRAQGRDIISLSLGEPDFDTPEFIKAAAIAAIKNGQTKYTPVGGTPSIKQAVIDKFARDNQLSYEANQVLVSTGAKQCLFNALYAILNAGDEVIIPAPYWVSYPDMVLLADGVPVVIETQIEQGLKLLPEQLVAAITPKTKVVILNSPSNPSGVTYTKAELRVLGEVLLNYPNIWILSDDIYEKIAWGNEPFANIVNACPTLLDRSIVINGVSKAYAMTGWRIGFAGGPASAIAAMSKLQSQSTSCPNAIAQAAAAAALNGNQQCIITMLAAFKQRYQLVFERLNKMPGVQCLATSGAFYAFPNVQQAITRLGLDSDVAFAEYLLDKAGVAIVPGSAFGSPGFIRLSFAASEKVLVEALRRIEEAL